MSLKRLFHWLCNACGLEVTQSGYGLPKGWTVVVGKLDLNAGVNKKTHRCPACKDKPVTITGEGGEWW